MEKNTTYKMTIWTIFILINEMPVKTLLQNGVAQWELSQWPIDKKKHFNLQYYAPQLSAGTSAGQKRHHLKIFLPLRLKV